MSLSIEEEREIFDHIRLRREIQDLIREYNTPGDLSDWLTRSVLVLLKFAHGEIQ